MTPNSRFLRKHPAHFLALGLGSGLSPKAPGTAGTLWAWLAFLVVQPWMSDAAWAITLLVSLVVGWWACTITARNMGVTDPSAIVWDEVVAFWWVLWLVMPAGFLDQVLAFAIFRFFDAVKPGPVGWADRLFHHSVVYREVNGEMVSTGWGKAGLGIMLDDLVAAFCTLLCMAFWRLI